MEKKAFLESAKESLRIEAKAVEKLLERVDEKFSGLVELITQCSGKIIVTGVGKSGLVARKVAATLSSTGTPSVFLHPAEAGHGDLGMIEENDVVLMISNSGESEEIIKILPNIKTIGAKIVSFAGNANSTIARNSEISIHINVEREADPMNVAPTASAMAALAMGDALASALMTARNFTPERFALFHPGGVLGRKLTLKVSDLMHSGEKVPILPENAYVKEALYVNTRKRLGAVIAVDKEGKITGIITDGDVRRMLERTQDFLTRLLLTEVKDVMTKSPKSITADRPAPEAVKIMETHAITVLPVVDENNKPVGIVHLHDLVKAGLALESGE